MKFMKLGSKPDIFSSDGNMTRYVATELASDVIVNVGDVKFYLHKFPLLSKSARMQKLVAIAAAENSEEVHIPDIPGGAATFETCAKFCYGIAVTVNAYNVISVRCAAEYLGMNETIEKGNLIYKIDVFLSSSVFRSWKDSIILLQSTTALSSLTEDLKVVSHCIDSIACKASTNISRVDWAYTYNEVKYQKTLPEENVNRRTPEDWWVEDLCELDIDLFKRVITSIKSKGVVSNVVIGDALKAYTHRKLSELDKDHTMIESSMVDTIVWLLPSEKNSVSCSFLFNLLKAALAASSGEVVKRQLIRKIGLQLEEASMSDLLIKSPEGETIYDVDVVIMIVEEYVSHDQNLEIEEIKETGRRLGVLSDASKLMVAKVIDEYLAEIATDPNLPILKFVDIAEMVSGFQRPSHDGIYRAIDTFLKEHSCITKSERKRICKLMDTKKLSADTCVHAVQNERLPMRVIVQVLFFEQIRANALSGSSTPDLPKCITDLATGSNGSSRSATTNTEEDWDALATADELKSLKEELATLKLRSRSSRVREKSKGDGKNMVNKTKGSQLPSKKMFARMWSTKGGRGENSGSDLMKSPGSVKLDEAEITPSRNRRFSVS